MQVKFILKILFVLLMAMFTTADPRGRGRPLPKKKSPEQEAQQAAKRKQTIANIKNPDKLTSDECNAVYSSSLPDKDARYNRGGCRQASNARRHEYYKERLAANQRAKSPEQKRKDAIVANIKDPENLTLEECGAIRKWKIDGVSGGRGRDRRKEKTDTWIRGKCDRPEYRQARSPIPFLTNAVDGVRQLLVSCLYTQASSMVNEFVNDCFTGKGDVGRCFKKIAIHGAVIGASFLTGGIGGAAVKGLAMAAKGAKLGMTALKV